MLKAIITVIVIIIEAVVTVIITRKTAQSIKPNGKGKFTTKCFAACGIISALSYLLTVFVNTYFIILGFLSFALAASIIGAYKCLDKSIILPIVSLVTTVFVIAMAGIVLCDIAVQHTIINEYSATVKDESVVIPFDMVEYAESDDIIEDLSNKPVGEYNIKLETLYTCTYRQHDEQTCTCTNDFICPKCYPYAVPRKINITIQ